MVLAAQLVLSTLAGYAFARCEFRGRDLVSMLVLLQLMIMPDVLLVENYRSMSLLGVRDTVFAVGLPYFASAFGIFLLRQTFKTVPRELEEAARVEGAGPLQVLLLDKIMGVADALGYDVLSSDAKESREFAQHAALALDKPRIIVDLPGLSVGY